MRGMRIHLNVCSPSRDTHGNEQVANLNDGSDDEDSSSSSEGGDLDDEDYRGSGAEEEEEEDEEEGEDLGLGGEEESEGVQVNIGVKKSVMVLVRHSHHSSVITFITHHSGRWPLMSQASAGTQRSLYPWGG